MSKADDDDEAIGEVKAVSMALRAAVDRVMVEMKPPPATGFSATLNVAVDMIVRSVLFGAISHASGEEIVKLVIERVRENIANGWDDPMVKLGRAVLSGELPSSALRRVVEQGFRNPNVEDGDTGTRH
jgi:hypothetical protein